MVNDNRLAERFTMLAEIDSVSKEEGRIAQKLADILRDMGADVCFDDAGNIVGGETGNLIAKFKGNVDAEPIFFSGHMDTVEPGRGVKVVFKDGVFKSDGTTILGSDDKSALAIILEVMDILIEKNLPHPPIEIIFTICEEIGLLGAKAFDCSLLDSKSGYILDSTETDGIVIKAPFANRITIEVFGKDAHAGADPENGINAISVASKAISCLDLGRIDHETTCNLGKISGGKATNIVPDFVIVHGEARSHDRVKLQNITDKMVQAFIDAADYFRIEGSSLPRVDAHVEEDFPGTNIPEDHDIVMLAKKAAKNIGVDMVTKTIGGGSDANIFFGKGIIAGVLGTGMTNVHTIRESVKLADMKNTAELLLEIIKIRAAGDL